MKRAVANLIDNAAEALEHALQKEIWVRTALDAEHDVAEITVADSGPGIAPEDKEKLFLPFFSTKHRGTGLGLAIVSRIVAEQKGIIRVEENQPTGTKFIIELPVERTPRASSPVSRTERSSRTAWQRRLQSKTGLLTTIVQDFRLNSSRISQRGETIQNS